MHLRFFRKCIYLFNRFQGLRHIDLIQLKVEDKVNHAGGQHGQRHRNHIGLGEDQGLEPNHIDLDLGHDEQQQKIAKNQAKQASDCRQGKIFLEYIRR